MNTNIYISFCNTFLFLVFSVFFTNFNLLFLTLFTLAFFICSLFIATFFLIDLHDKIKYLSNVLNLIDKRTIPLLKIEFLKIEECFTNIFSSIKKDILELLIKENEIKRAKENAEKLSSDLTFLNKNLENIVSLRTKELSIAKEDAEAANRSKDEFLAKVSHEMRTPLTPIIGYSRTLKKEHLDIDIQKKLDIIQNAGIKLLNFTNELLDFSKYTFNHANIIPESFDIKELLNQIYYENLPIAEQKNINFKISTPNSNLIVETDRTKVYIIIKNIIQNAIKYTNQGFVLCELQIEHNFMLLDIYDSGIGIPKENIDNIFESFKQINIHSPGAGLGLSITKKLVDLLNGDIKVLSTPGIGTTFSIKLPIKLGLSSNSDFITIINKLLSSNNNDIVLIIIKSLLRLPIRLKQLKDVTREKNIDKIIEYNHLIMGTYGNLSLTPIYNISKKISKEIKNENVDFNKILFFIEEIERLIHLLEFDNIFYKYIFLKNITLNILIVEDVEENRDFFSTLLSHENINVTYAVNGYQCLEILNKSQDFNVIFLDIHMPVMDGIETIKSIKSNYTNFKIPIIALTAQAMPSDKKRFLSMGFNSYVTKPINDSVFFSTIENFISNHNKGETI